MSAIDNGMVSGWPPSYRDPAPVACCECGHDVHQQDLPDDHNYEEAKCIRCQLVEALEERDEAQRLLAAKPTSLQAICERLKREFPGRSIHICMDCWSFGSVSGALEAGLIISGDGISIIHASSIDHAIASAKCELEMAQADCDVLV